MNLEAQLNLYVAVHRQKVIAGVENWWDKYLMILHVEEKRDEAAKRLEEFFRRLGYE